MNAEMVSDVVDLLAVSNSNPGQVTPTPRLRSIATLDILPDTQSCWSEPVHRVSEINAENPTGVNRVIAETSRQQESNGRISDRGEAAQRDVLRLTCRTFKRKRNYLFGRFAVIGSVPSWSMLHRSRPDLIKGISTRSTETPSTSNRGDVDTLRQSTSTSENSLHSSGSGESQPVDRYRHPPTLSRNSSVGDASGSSTPTQVSNLKPTFRKKENRRAEIVASVTSRLYATKKRPDPRLEALQASQATEKDEEDDDELEELKLCKRARMKLFDLSRKLAMAKKVKRTTDSDTQTELLRSTLRVKEKSVATEQQGILQVLSCATNTPVDPNLLIQEPPVVMNQIYLPNSGNFVLECGSAASTLKLTSTSQTKDQATSPEASDKVLVDETFSDDSLDSDEISLSDVPKAKRKSQSANNLFDKNSYSCKSWCNLDSSLSKFSTTAVPVSNREVQNFAFQKRSIDSLLGKDVIPMYIERDLRPICRYSINGTNAIYEYDPNRNIFDKVVFPNTAKKPNYSAGHEPSLIYPNYSPSSINNSSVENDGLLGSDETVTLTKSQQAESNEENLSSGTSFGSNVSSAGSDTSSDDFVFIGNVPFSKPNRDLYTISEFSEPPASNQSTPHNSQSPRLDRTDESSSPQPILHSSESTVPSNSENEAVQVPIQSESLKKPAESTPKTVKWAEMQCNSNRQFLNFKFKPTFLDKRSHEDSVSQPSFPSEDSITFVFLGPSPNKTSVLMEVVKQSLQGNPNHRGRSRTRNKEIQNPRSVSVDTALIALSRLSKDQQMESDMTRSSSVNALVTDTLLAFLEPKPGFQTQSVSTQCDTETNEGKNLVPTEIHSECLQINSLSSCQTCSREKMSTTDRETETDTEKRQMTTQTEANGDEFGNEYPELPRRTISPNIYENDCAPQNRIKELKHLILGTSRNLFPEYFNDTDSPIKPKSKNKKSVSFNNLSNETHSDNFDRNTSTDADPIHDFIPDYNEPAKPNERSPAATISAFLREAATLLDNINESTSCNSAVQLSEQEKCTNSLLRRRNVTLPKMDMVNLFPLTKAETAVQTDVETMTKLVQTGSFASSLIGPPVKRKELEETRNERTEDVYNLTWPRRRLASKPPTGLKQSLLSARRSGSISSRASVNSTESCELSPSSSQIQDGNRNDDWKGSALHVGESCQRLQLAVETDKARQQALTFRMESLFKDSNDTEIDRRRKHTDYFKQLPAYATLPRRYQEDRFRRGISITSLKNEPNNLINVEQLQSNLPATKRQILPNFIERQNVRSPTIIDTHLQWKTNSPIGIANNTKYNLSQHLDSLPASNWNDNFNNNNTDEWRSNTPVTSLSDLPYQSRSPTLSPYLATLDRHSYRKSSSPLRQNERKFSKLQGFTTNDQIYVEDTQNLYVNDPYLLNGTNAITYHSLPNYSNKKELKTTRDPGPWRLRSHTSYSQQKSEKFSADENVSHANETRRYNSHNSLISCFESDTRSQCLCYCHRKTSGKQRSRRYCHTCCVPCNIEKTRPYCSEPRLASLHSDCVNSIDRKTSPSSYLKYLVSIRRDIVSAQSSVTLDL